MVRAPLDQVGVDGADAFDGGDELVARCEESGRRAGAAHAGGRAGEDEVTGQERRDRRQSVDQCVDPEDEIGRAALLHLLTVHRATEGEVVTGIELIWRDDPRTGRPEPREGLAQAELRRRWPRLDDAFREVLTDGQPRDV